MKPVHVFSIAAAITLLFLNVPAKAQEQPVPSTVVAKTTAVLPLAAAVADPDEIVLDGLKLRSEKMYQHFTRNFKGANSISIFPGEKSTVIYCQVKGIRNNILYTNKGKIQHSIRYYNAELLPQQVFRMLSRDFPDYKMNVVSEVTADGQTAYLVNMEGFTKFKMIRVLNGSWDVYQEFDKQR